jgi:hypothetical protein
MTTSLAPANGAAAPETSLNPFNDKRKASTAAVEVESARAIAETQAAMVIAQRFPRNQAEAVDRILQAFTRPTLAEKAMYAYARGGTNITGPSIRAAEAIALEYGNLQFGVRELEQRPGVSTVEAFCWDVQTNVRSAKIFQVAHIRHTRSSQTRLEDPRDIYELVANQGARRLRSCILQIVPSDITEAAVQQAELTLRTKVKITDELIQSLLDKFASIGVSRRVLEAKIQRRIEAVTPALVVQLGKIFNAIEDGMAAVSDHFHLEEDQNADAPGRTRTDALAEKLAKKNQVAAAAGDDAAKAAPESATAQETPAGDATPGADAEKPAAVSTPADDKQKARSLRTAILSQWKDRDAERTAALTREYAKSDLLSLNVAQLEDFLAKTPQLLAALPVKPAVDNGGAAE